MRMCSAPEHSAIYFGRSGARTTPPIRHSSRASSSSLNGTTCWLRISESRNCRRLLSIPELKDDVSYCLQRDSLSTVIEMDKEGTVLHSAVSA